MALEITGTTTEEVPLNKRTGTQILKSHADCKNTFRLLLKPSRIN